MPAIRSLDEISKKWAEVTPGRAGHYTRGVQNPKRDWEAATKGAEESYNRGVTDAIGRGAFGKGVTEAGTAKWQAKASTLGSQRFGPGVAAAEPEYKKGFAEFHSVIERTTLPPRGPKGDPANIERVRTMAEALHRAKVS